ncbi:MAG TPA: DnaJ domain-containing protein [Candidatus Binatia bacterium]
MRRDVSIAINMLRKNYYLTLGVSRNESAHGIREAFRELAQRYHPDRLGPARLHFFQEILEAYHVLADPVRRSEYDRALNRGGAREVPSSVSISAGAGEQRNLPLPISILRVLTVRNAAFEAALARVSGRLTAAEVSSKKYPDGLAAGVILSADEAAQGGIIFLAVPSCSPCERCGGSGRKELFPCEWCDGEGLIEEEEIVRIHVPPGVSDVTRLEVPLRGLGIHNFYLRLHIRVVSETTRPGFQ